MASNARVVKPPILGSAHAWRQARGKSAGCRTTWEDTVRCWKERMISQTPILSETPGGRAGRIHLANVRVGRQDHAVSAARADLGAYSAALLVCCGMSA
jgi:hypothetical protein